MTGTTELSNDAQELLSMVEDCGGAEIPEEDWVFAQELKEAGLVEVSGARGPGNQWKRVILSEPSSSS